MIYYQLRVRNADDSGNALTVTSVPGGTNPLISEPPTGDGQGTDPRTGATEIGAYTIRIADNGSSAAAVTGFLADASGRYDKLGRKAYLEYGTDGTTFPTQLVAGYVTAISYPSAAEAQITIGEAQRSEERKKAFEAANTTFPATTMLAGGPIRTSNPWVANDMPDLGGWRMKVNATPSSAAFVPLQFVSGSMFISDDATAATFIGDGHLPSYTWQRINSLLSTEAVKFPPQLDGATLRYPLRNVYVDVYSSGSGARSLVGTFPVYRQPAIIPATYFDIAPPDDLRVLDTTNTLWADFTGVAAPSSGTLYDVYLYTRTISEANPLHVFAHPMDVITGLITDAGDSYDSTSAAALEAEIGADVRVFLRITESYPVSDIITRLLGVFGVGRRVNSSNAWEFFSQRAKGAAPATTLTLADLREIPTDVWTLEESSIVNTVTVTQQLFALWADGNGTRPADNLIASEQTRSADYLKSDGTLAATSQGTREITYSIPGTIASVTSRALDLQQFTAAMASPIFDRWGHGAPRTTLVCRDSVTAQVGDEVILNMAFLPNGNVRSGARIVQIVQRTNEPGGPVIVVEDAGLSSQPSTSPTFTITANAAAPRSVADVALTNAAALTSAGVASVLFEWIVSASSPAIAGQDLGSITPVSATTLSTPPVAAGSKVWARGKSVQPGRRPSAWTAWADVTLSAVGAPGSLTATPSGTDGSLCPLTWTAGSSSGTYQVEVCIRQSSSTAADRRVALLMPGSLRYTIEGLTPSTAYVATVRYVDSDHIVVASATVSFTAGATTYALSAPIYPAGFAGSRDRITGALVRDGLYGIGVVPSSFPGAIEVQVATETSVGSGSYGAFATVGQAIPAILGDWTLWVNTAPNDGLRRQLKARHVRAGATSSAYTATVTVTPWVPVALPAFPIGAFYNCDTSESGGNGTVTVVVNDPLSALDTTTRVTFTSLILGVKTTGIAATTAPSAGITTGTYTYTFTLDEKHPITIGVVGTNRDATTTKVGEFTFDFDKNANVVNLAIVDDDVTAVFDTDTITGAALVLPTKGPAQYSVNGGAWVNVAVDGTTRVAAFTVTQTSVTQALRVRGINSAGDAGPAVEGVVGALTTVGPRCDVRQEITVSDFYFHVTTGSSDRIWWRYDAATTYTNTGVDGSQTLSLARNSALGASRPVSIKTIDTLGNESAVWTGSVLPREPLPVPPLDVRVDITATNYAFVATTNAGARLWYRVDPATSYTDYGANGSQTINVGRPAAGAADISVSIKAIEGGITGDVVTSIVAAQALSITLTVGNCTASNAGALGPPWNRLVVAFSSTGMPTGTTYDCSYINRDGGMDSQTGVTSPVTFNSVTFGGDPAAGTSYGAVTVLAKATGVLIGTAVKNKSYLT